MISSDDAFENVKEHLGAQVKGPLSESEIKTLSGWNVSPCRQMCWVFRIGQAKRPSMLGGGRIICVSKETGEVVYDGSDGGE